MALRGFALYSVIIFEPIYLYLFFDKSIALAFLFIGIRAFVFGILAPVGVKIVNKIGIKHTILLSVPVTFLYFLGLWQIERFGDFAYLLALWGALGSMLHWPAYHIFFTRVSDRGYRGKETSYRTIILSITASIAPLVGGFIISVFGFPTLFMVVLALLFSAVIPLFLSGETYERFDESYKEIFKDLFRKKYRRRFLSFVALGTATSVQKFVWPLFLFVLAISFKDLGIITSASLIIGMVFVYYIGKVADKMGPRVLGLGVVLSAIIWPIKMFVTTPLTAFLANTLHRFSRSATLIPFSAMFYDWAEEYEDARDRIVLLREIGINTSRGILMLTLAFIFATIAEPEHLKWTFIVGAVFTLGLLAIIKKPSRIFRVGKE